MNALVTLGAMQKLFCTLFQSGVLNLEIELILKDYAIITCLDRLLEVDGYIAIMQMGIVFFPVNIRQKL